MEKNFISEIKSLVSEYTAKEWIATIVGVLIFIIISGICC